MKIVQNNENLSQNAIGRKEKYFKNKNVKSTAHEYIKVFGDN